ncbi:MAG: hypothetical protein JNK90_14785 [Planctomycetaceae bacterium]|nr:hypothetical protein [Planctomycetaceae bacterium]
MPKDSNPDCPLLQQFAHDLKIAGLRERTQESYGTVLRKFNESCKKPLIKFLMKIFASNTSKSTWLKVLVTLTVNLVRVIELEACQPESKRRAQCVERKNTTKNEILDSLTGIQ